MQLKKNFSAHTVTRAGLFLALAIMIQGIRLLFPWLSGPLGALVIGGMVKACLLLAVWQTKSYAACGIAFILPVIAFLQGQLPLAVLIPVVGLSLCTYALLVRRFRGTKPVWLAPPLSAAVCYAGVMGVNAWLELPAPLVKVLSLSFGWGQVVTGVIGIVLAERAWNRLAGKL